MSDAAVLVEVTRDGFVESRQRGWVVVLDPTGATRLACGDVTSAILPRSCLKPLQAVGMVRAGLPLRGEPLALACASHSGETGHARLAETVLTDRGLTAGDLRCTPDLPLDRKVRERYLRAGGHPDRLRANCSGKHAAMRIVCDVNGWAPSDYLDAGHPLQVALRETVEDLTKEPVAATTVDGCGAPAFAVSLTGLARAFAVIARAGRDGGAEYAVAEAMRGHPWAVGGAGREVTRLIEGAPGIIAKDGAEGVAAAALPDGTAVAVKIEDGDLGSRAAFRVLVAVLRSAGVEGDVLDDLATVPVLGHGRPVGVVNTAMPLRSVVSTA